MDIDNNQLEEIYNRLNDALENLKKINEDMGATARAEAMKLEIKKLGWSQIVVKYHPDMNYKDPAAKELFAMYKYLFEYMRGRGEI